MILAELKADAEAWLGVPVERAVITVPAYFNDGQRQATKDAGRIAGLEVLRIINEPTSAALAYGFGKQLERKVVVYDLGGGTFDVSVLDIGRSVYDVVAVGADTYLGGEDFDRRVIDWLTFGFAKENGGIDLRQDKMALQRLKDVAEKAKCELSATATAAIHLPFLVGGGDGKAALHLDKQLGREKLEELTKDLVDRCVAVAEKTLKDAGVRPSQVGEVILVGGMTRMPRVQQAVRDFFGREPSRGVHPEEVVALGAAIQAHSLLYPQKDRDVLLLDVTPQNLGLLVVGGYFTTVIPKNTTVPTSQTHIFTTVQDDQTQARIVVLQGESEKAIDNEMLGEFVLSGIRAARRGVGLTPPRREPKQNKSEILAFLKHVAPGAFRAPISELQVSHARFRPAQDSIEYAVTTSAGTIRVGFVPTSCKVLYLLLPNGKSMLGDLDCRWRQKEEDCKSKQERAPNTLGDPKRKPQQK